MKKNSTRDVGSRPIQHEAKMSAVLGLRPIFSYCMSVAALQLV